MKKVDREPSSSDEGIEQALDRLGELTAPPSAASESDFVSRVMRQIGDAPSLRRPRRSQRLARLAIAVAACAIAALVFWPTAAAHRPAPDVVAAKAQNEASSPRGLPADASPAVRISTWSTITESVVLEQDVPVRKLLYREFERVELVDANGNTEGQMVVPTKAMLLATKERY